MGRHNNCWAITVGVMLSYVAGVLPYAFFGTCVCVLYLAAAILVVISPPTLPSTAGKNTGNQGRHGKRTFLLVTLRHFSNALSTLKISKTRVGTGEVD